MREIKKHIILAQVYKKVRQMKRVKRESLPIDLVMEINEVLDDILLTVANRQE